MATSIARWILFAATAMRCLLFSGSVKANGVILEDLIETSGSSYSLVAWAFALQNGLAFFVSPLTYFILDKVGHRELCVTGGVLSGLGYIFCGFYMDEIWQIFIGFSMSGVGFGFSSLSSYMVLQSYFDDQELPITISFLSTFDFVGVALLPPLLQFFLDTYGLRNSIFLLGAVVWHNVLCGAAIKNPPKTSKSEIALTEDATGSTTLFRQFMNDVASLLRQKKFVIILIIEVIGFYIFISWALFLVSLGKDAGLSGDQAVLLSTAGGVGGLIGRILAIITFKMNWVNAITSSLLPLSVTALAFVVMAFTGDFVVLIVLVTISGISQGFNSSCVFSLVPTCIPRTLYQTAVALEFLFDGIAMQFSGLCSGLILDLTGSTIYVYQSLALLCVLVIPLVLIWARGDKDARTTTTN